jgi:hypothetical protein
MNDAWNDNVVFGESGTPESWEQLCIDDSSSDLSDQPSNISNSPESPIATRFLELRYNQVRGSAQHETYNLIRGLMRDDTLIQRQYTCVKFVEAFSVPVLAVDPGERRWLSMVDSFGTAHIIFPQKSRECHEFQRLDEWHQTMIDWMVSFYRIILIPFEVPRKLEQLWMYGLFISRLQQAAAQRCVTVIDVDEYRSSSTCSRCGFYDKKGDKKRNFRCYRCRMTMDRDVNAALNLLLWFQH